MAINKIRETLNNSRPSFLSFASFIAEESSPKTFHTWKVIGAWKHRNPAPGCFFFLLLLILHDGNGIHRRQTKPCSTYKSNLTYRLVKETLGKTILGKITKVKIQKYVGVQSWICQLWKFECNRRGTESKKKEKWGEKQKKSYRCPKFDGDAKQTLEIRVERKRNNLSSFLVKMKEVY